MTDLAFTDVRLTSAKPVDATTITLGETCAQFDLVQGLSGKFLRSTATDIDKAKPSHMILQAGVDLDNVAAFPLTLGQDFKLIGATVVLGTQYVLSANLGKIAPRADLIATNVITDIAKGISISETITISLESTGIIL